MKKNKSALAFNPYIRISFNSSSKSFLLLEDLENKKTYSAELDLLDILKFSDRPQSKDKIIAFIKEEELNKSQSPEDYIQDLVKNRILVDETEFNEKSESLELWAKYNWMMAAHFILESENQVFDDNNSTNNQNPILNEYLADDDLTFYKTYPKSKKIVLPKPNKLKTKPLKETLLSRRTKRKYTESIELQNVSTLLHYSTKELRMIRDEQEKKYRKDPKTLLKSLFTPFEIYIVSNRINNIDNGIYHYNLKEHTLEEVKKGTFNRDMSLIAHGEMFLDNAAFIVIITGILPRYMFRYRYSRAYKELLMTCSQLAHYIILYATLMEIKTFETPALLDSWLTKLFSLEEGKEEGLYLLGFGK